MSRGGYEIRPRFEKNLYTYLKKKQVVGKDL